MLRLVLIIGFIAVLAACTGNQPTPVVEQASLSGPVVVTSPVAATDVPQKVTPVPSATPTATAVPPPNTPTPKPSLEDLLLDNARHIHGAEDAPVTFIEFSDFKWGYCGRFATGSLSRMREEYIDTGQVRFIFRHSAVLGPESTKAAEGSECAADQGAFWPYHDLLFADQVENRSSVTDDYLVALAETLGLDIVAFKGCLDTAGYDNEVIEMAMRIKSRGARGVPGFMINGQFITGAIPYESFQQYIEQELAK